MGMAFVKQKKPQYVAEIPTDFRNYSHEKFGDGEQEIESDFGGILQETQISCASGRISQGPI